MGVIVLYLGGRFFRDTVYITLLAVFVGYATGSTAT